MSKPTNPAASALPLFYRRPRVLQPGLHAQLGLQELANHAFSRDTNAVPLLAAEMPAASRHMPIVFTDEPLPQPVAVLGLRERQNQFVDSQGCWQPGAYVPAYVRRYPFIFLEDSARRELTLCIDEDAPSLVSDGSGQALFDAAGQPTAVTRSALAFCRDYQAHHLLTQAFADALVTAGVLVDHRAELSLGDKTPALALQGFKVVDEARFKALPDSVFLHWRAKGWLPWIYSHLLSVSSWAGLANTAAAHLASFVYFPSNATAHSPAGLVDSQS